VTWQFLLAIVGSSALTAAVQAYFTRRKTSADAGKSEAEAEATTLKEMRETMQVLLEQAQSLMGQLETAQKKYGEALQENVGLKALVTEYKATIDRQRGTATALTNEVQSFRRQLNDLEAAIGKLAPDGNGNGYGEPKRNSKDPLPQ